MLADDIDTEALQRELFAVREERDLCRALLLADSATARNFRREAGLAIERLPALLKQSTRETAAFCNKLQRLGDEMRRLGDLIADLPLPALGAEIEAARHGLDKLQALPEPTGDELLPIVPLIDAVMTTLRSAAPIADAAPATELVADDPATHESRQLSRLELALQQLAAQLAIEHRKELRLVARGVDAIPDDWFNALFDVSSQLLRNAVEYGIELPEQRVARGKPVVGTLEIGFVPIAGGYEYSFRDDGAGLDAERIITAGKAHGFVGKGSEGRDAQRAATLIFKPGVSTADDSAGRGNGMQIVREQIRRLGGKLQIATKRGRFTCLRADLPALPVAADVGNTPHA